MIRPPCSDLNSAFYAFHFQKQQETQAALLSLAASIKTGLPGSVTTLAISDVTSTEPSLDEMSPIILPDRGRQRLLSSRATQKRHLLRFQSYLLGRTLEAFWGNTAGSWTFVFKTRKVVSWDSPSFTCVRKNNITGLQQLLESKEASLNEVNEHGRTLLHVRSELSEAAFKADSIHSKLCPTGIR